MKRLFAALGVSLACVAFAATAQAKDPNNYGIAVAEAAIADTQAGGHPDFTTVLDLKREPDHNLPATTRDTFFELPPGLTANPQAVGICSLAQFLSTDVESPDSAAGCPPGSQVGISAIEVFRDGSLLPFNEPVYNLAPRSGQAARLGFFVTNYPVMIDARLDPAREYGVTVAAEGVSSLVPLLSARTEIWGVPADESHDAQRITPYEVLHGGVPKTPNGKRSAGLVPKPFMLNPTRCGVAQGVNIAATSYALPGKRFEALAPLEANTGCGQLDFSPDLSAAPTTSEAETGAGLDVELEFPIDGLEHPNLNAEAEQKRVVLTLPEGVTVNPSQAVGLGVCSEADFANETAASLPNEGCPESSKIGTVSAKSPLLNETAEGGLFIAKPRQNPFGTLIALYMVLKIPERGVIVKLPIKVEPDPKSGRLISTVENIPQLPVQSFHLHFREGARSPLVTPPTCGTFTSTATFTSWAGQTVTTHPSFQITRGVEGGPCPSGTTPPFKPGFEAGALNNNAGSYSEFDMRLTRRDGDQDLTKFSATLPPGMTGKLAGISKCSDAAIEAAKSRNGRDELASPSCPASSQLGSVLAGAGVGQVLTYATGKVYLAGPYHGAPLSVAAIVPAVAGPFDVGTVVTRVALRIDPRTAEVKVDGASSDPIPHILAGIPLKVRDIRVYADRPNFTLNPTSCDVSKTTAEIWGGGNDVFSVADDSPFPASDRFQAANCSTLGFKPKLSLKLTGGTKRGGHPALTGTYKPRAGDANLKDLVLRFPHSAFLDQAHIRTICTRVQFAAKACPPGAVYGHVKAITPILDEPLEGPVILRSSNHNLPDFVADLHGLVDVEAVARIDSVRGGIRATFTDAPDAPLTKVVVAMQGAKKGLIVNSTDLCRGSHKAKAQFTAHNAKQSIARPEMQAECKQTHKRHHSKH